jgi:hypothetical protein
MSKQTKRAESLREVEAAVTLDALTPEDGRYVDLAPGRLTKDLKLLRLHLEQAALDPTRFTKATLTGNRGCGKTTELLRLERDLEPLLYPVHLYVDPMLERDFDYTDMLLWMVDELSRCFANAGMPLDKGLVDDVASWFADRTLEQVSNVKSELEASTTAEAKAKAGVYWLSLGLLARIKSSIVGSTERRELIRRELQKNARDLIERVNLVLDNAHTQLEKHCGGKPPLIVQDNADRLPPEPGRRLFIDNGDLLKQVRANILFTVPVGIVMAPSNIGQVFEHAFYMPTIKPRLEDGNPNEPGLKALQDLVEGRLAIEKVFAASDLVRQLALMSGGSVRDLLRLVGYAAAEALVDGKDRIDAASVELAVKRLRREFEGSLIPGQVYYPILARIHRTKRDQLVAGPTVTPDEVRYARGFFGQLLFNGSVLEYNGDGQWFDAHPAVQLVRSFQDALRAAQSETLTRTQQILVA